MTYDDRQWHPHYRSERQCPNPTHRHYVGGLGPVRARRGVSAFAVFATIIGVLCLSLIALGAVAVSHRSERCLQLRAQAQMVNSSAWIDECAR